MSAISLNNSLISVFFIAIIISPSQQIGSHHCERREAIFLVSFPRKWESALFFCSDLPSPIQNANHPMLTESTDGGKIVPIADLEREAILRTIDQLKGDKLLAARLLGIGKTTLYRKLKEYATED